MTPSRVVRGLGIIALAGAAVIAALMGFFWWERSHDTTLPRPNGRFAVGRTMYHWVNDAAPTGSHAPDAPGRELVGWVWYPAADTAGSVAESYIPVLWLRAMQQRAAFPIKMLTRDVARVHAHSIRAPVSVDQRRYPVLIIRGGLGAQTLDYTTIAEELASHGFVIVGFDAPYRTGMVVFSDGRIVTRPPENNPETLPAAEQPALANRLLAGWTADTRFVMDELERLDASDSTGLLTGRLDLRAIGVFGHSLGGATAAQVCYEDPRCGGAVDIDGAPFGSVVREKLARPFMLLLSDHGADTSNADGRRILEDLRSLYGGAPSDARYWMTIRGTRHFNFTDQVLLKEPHLSRLLGLAGPIDQRRGLAVTSEYVRRFFDVSLRGAPHSLLEPTAKFPEIERDPLM